MPVESQEIVTYNNWVNGPWHSWGPEYGPKENHDYDCVNMQVYANGSLGPRPCLKPLFSNIYLLSETYQKFRGAFWFQEDDAGGQALNTSSDADSSLHVIETGTATKRSYDVTADAAVAGSYTADWSSLRTQLKPSRYYSYGGGGAWDASPETVISSLHFKKLGDKNMIIGGDGYLHNLDDYSADGYQTITAGTAETNYEYPSNWDPIFLFGWRDRYWSWGDYDDGSNHAGNRIHYSKVGDIKQWTALGFIDVGADSDLPIIGVWPVFDNLLIAMADGRWYKYTFTDDPDFGEIRYIGTKVIPDFYVTAATTGSAIIFITKQSGIVVATKDTIDDQTFNYIKVPQDGDDSQDVFFMRGMSSQAHNAICLPYMVKTVGSSVPNNVYKGNRSLELVNGVWTQHLYFGPGDDSVLDSSFVDAVPMGNDHWGFFASPIYNTANSSTTFDDRFYMRPVTLNRPSNSNDTYTTNTEVADHTNDTDDRFEGVVWLATYRPPDKASGSIEKVIIDFDYWHSTTTGDASTGFTAPAFTVKADCVHEGDEISTVTVGSLDANELAKPTSASYMSKRGRVVLRPARMPLSSQIDISITGIKSVALKEVSVVYSVQAQTPLTNINT